MVLHLSSMPAEDPDPCTQLLDTLPQIVCIVNVNGRITGLNAKGRRTFAFSEEDFKGHEIGDLFPVGERERFLHTFHAVLKGETARTSLYTIEKRNGDHLQVLPVFFPICSEEVPGGVAVNLVHVDAASTTSHLDSRPEDMYAFFDSFPQSAFEVDMTGRYVYLNRHACLEFGVTQEDLDKGLSCFDLVAPSDRERALKNYSCRTRCRLPESRYLFQRRDGSTLHGILHSAPVVRDGAVVGTRGVVINIEDIKAAQELLRRTNERLLLLSSITRHDQMNLLTALCGWIEVAREENTDPEITAYLKKASGASEILRKHIEFSREYQTLGLSTPQWQKFSVIFRSACSLLGTGVPLPTISSELGQTEIYAVPMIDRAFFTLFENAVRHGMGVTEIRVSVRAGDRPEILVEDNGCGIPPCEKKKIFKLGYGKNTGLGLYLTKEILATTEIGIREDGVPEKGARFVLSVPKNHIRGI